MKLFVFATLEEAQASISHLKAKPCGAHFEIDDETLLLISGIGPFAAYTSLLPFVDKVDTIYNFGIAGTLSDAYKEMSCYEVAQSSKLHWHPKNSTFSESIVLKKTGPSLCTLDFPLSDKTTAWYSSTLSRAISYDSSSWLISSNANSLMVALSFGLSLT